MALLDLRQLSETTIRIDPQTIHTVIWDGIPTMDTGYTITLNEGGNDPKTYTVGNGITLDTENNIISWLLDSTSFTETKYEGKIQSDSKVGGIWLSIKIYVLIG